MRFGLRALPNLHCLILFYSFVLAFWGVADPTLSLMIMIFHPCSEDLNFDVFI